MSFGVSGILEPHEAEIQNVHGSDSVKESVGMGIHLHRQFTEEWDRVLISEANQLKRSYYENFYYHLGRYGSTQCACE